MNPDQYMNLFDQILLDLQFGRIILDIERYRELIAITAAIMFGDAMKP